MMFMTRYALEIQRHLKSSRLGTQPTKFRCSQARTNREMKTYTADMCGAGDTGPDRYVQGT